MAIYIINVLLFAFNIAISNFFRLIIWSCLLIDKTLLILFNFYISILLLNNMSILLNLKKSISKTILTLILTIKNVF